MPEYKYMPVEDISQLTPGMMIKHKVTETTYRVTDNFGDRATAVRVADVTNPGEWLILKEDTLKDLNRN